MSCRRISLFLKGSKEDLNSQKEIGSFLIYLSEFINKNKLKLVIIEKDQKIDDISLNENFQIICLINIYQKENFMKVFKFKTFIYPQDNKILSSYKYSMQSEVTIEQRQLILRNYFQQTKKF